MPVHSVAKHSSFMNAEARGSVHGMPHSCPHSAAMLNSMSLQATRRSCQALQLPGAHRNQSQMASYPSASVVEVGVRLEGSAVGKAFNPHTLDLSKTLLSGSPPETRGFCRDWEWSEMEWWWAPVRDDVLVEYIVAAFCSHHGLNPDQYQLCLAGVALHAEHTVRQVCSHARSLLRRCLRRLNGNELCRQLCLLSA